MSAGRPTLLAGILQSTREELAHRKRALPLETLAARSGRDAHTRATFLPASGWRPNDASPNAIWGLPSPNQA